jgi:TrmH family RNA methyltransferase
MTETCIHSRDNPLFKRLKKLAESARARRDARMTLLDGEHLLAAYLDAGGEPQTLVRAESKSWPASIARCPAAKTVVLADALFAELSPVVTPTGILAEAGWVAPVASPGVALVVVLEDIQDPGNLGAMLRTAAAAGATLAILSKACHDPWSPKALRGGQGAQFILPMRHDDELPAWLQHFEGQSVALALDEHAATIDFYTLDLRLPTALIVGNEGAGVSSALAQAASVRARIPMPGRVESLNAAAALAVAAFETVRQRQAIP